MRPIWFEFPKEEKHFEEEKAWMVGHALLVRAVVEKDTYNVNVELPSGEDKDPLTLFVALDRGGNAKGNVYLDDGATHDYKQGAFVVADFAYNTTSNDEAEFTGQPAADSGKYETETWIERIEVRGVERTPAKVSEW
ncbi:hypothetical protein COOONC_13905 [Cooperia oncophora]